MQSVRLSQVCYPSSIPDCVPSLCYPSGVIPALLSQHCYPSGVPQILGVIHDRTYTSCLVSFPAFHHFGEICVW